MQNIHSTSPGDSTIHFVLNRQVVDTPASPGMVLLDFLRREHRLVGTKEGCREGDCGACTVLLGEPGPDGVRYRTVASCLLPLAAVADRHVVTIEGLNHATLTPVQQAIVDEGATQCGFCTPGFVVALTGFLLGDEEVCAEQALAAMEGNICRCTGYVSLVRAARRLGDRFGSGLPPPGQRIPALMEAGVLPPGFDEATGGLGERVPVPPPAGGMIVAGGTDLFVQDPEKFLPGPLRSLDREPGLHGIRVEGGDVCIGAATPTEDLLQSAEVRAAVPGIEHYLRLVSSRLMRHRATVAGNLVNASPIGDLSIMLLALDAVLDISGEAGRRTLPVRSFFKAYKDVDLRPGELIEAIRWASTPGRMFHFEKVSKRRYLDIASVNTALSLTLEGGLMRRVGLSAGGVAPVPLFLAETSAGLEGQPPEPAVVDEAVTRAGSELAPIDDVRGSADYKRRLAQSLIRAHFIELFPESIGGGGSP